MSDFTVGTASTPTPAVPEWAASQLAHQAAWDEATVARYLTVAGATVGLTRSNDPEADDATQRDETLAVCGGCKATKAERWNTRPNLRLVSVVEAEIVATAEARRWAQAHASVCRALPRPTQ